MTDLPTWALAASHILTGGAGGIITAYLTSRGSARKGRAAVIEAADGRIDLAFDRLEAEIDRLERQQQQEREECDRRISALEETVDRERGQREELEATVEELVDYIDSLGEDIPEELEVIP